MKKDFDITPKIAWHCDAFGHSSGMNYLFQLMGYDHLFFGRINDVEKDIRKKSRDMEF